MATTDIFYGDRLHQQSVDPTVGVDGCFHSALLASVGQAIVAVDLDRTIIFWNKAAEAMFGWTAQEALGRNSNDVLVRSQTAGRSEEIRDAVTRGQEWSGEIEVEHRDGTRLWVFVTNRPVLDAEGRLIAIVGSSIDISQRKAEDTARQQLAAIVASSADAIFGVTLDGRITSWNHAAETLFGYTADEIVGESIGVLASDDLRHEQKDLRARLQNGSPFEVFETTRRRKDGTLVDVLLTASRTNDEQGRMMGSSVIARDITAELKARRALEASSRRLAEAQRIAHLGSFEISASTNEMIWSDEMYRIFGAELGQPFDPEAFLAGVHPDDLLQLTEVWAHAKLTGTSFDHLFRVVRPDGTERSVRARVESDLDADGRVLKMSGTVADQTEWVEAEAIRRDAENRFEIGFEQSAIGAVIADLNGIPLRVNKVVCEILDRTPEDLIGRQWTDFSHPDELPLKDAVRMHFATSLDTYQDERRYIRPDGSIAWASTHVALVRDHDVPQYVYVQLKDITERKEMEAESSHRALHDSLTGLPNRLLLTDRLVHGLARAKRLDARLGVIFLDLDQFKVVNDSLGHTSGDVLLSEAAKRIEGAIRPGDTVARFGGDEFVIVCDDVTGVEAQLIARRVLRAFVRPWLIDEQEVHVTASLGIALSNDDSTPESLLRDSDIAMYRAKELGRGRIELFDETLSRKASRRLSMSSALHHALERDELSVHYQPVADLATSEMVGVEALLRWQCGSLGEVSPAEFIPIAEETGLIVPIGAWLLEESSRQTVEWQLLQTKLGLGSTLSLAVNLSVRQMLSPDITDRIARVLARSGMKSADLCLELTESVFMQDADYFGRTLNDLKALGVSLAIDDFGTGYSSLSYLRRFPVDAVKIDRAFVDGLETDSNDTALVQAIIAMARALGLSVTAEGVETEQQMNCLTELGVPRAQGFYLARPMPADGVTRLIKSGGLLGPSAV
ncbi:MAG: EAL domain-containing protein [Ilumatobacteraceae bacterium]